MISYKDLKKNLKKDKSMLLTIKVALLGDTATQFLATAIKGYGIEYGFNIDLFEAEYNQIERQFLDPTSDLFKFDPQFIVVFQSTHKLNEKFSSLDTQDQLSLAKDRINFITEILNLTKAKIIYFNYPEIEDSVFGSYQNKLPQSFVFQVRKLNYELMQLSEKEQNFFVCDLSAIQNKYGRNFMFDAMIYTNTEMILSIDAVPLVAKRVIDIISAIQGKFKKCVILDLDNTLWGGVIGDDGLEGIQLGHGLGIGKAFTEFQMWLKKLKNRGIILCVCSKNDEKNAKEPFLKHPDMILHLEDISVFMANWETKVDNIRQIQQILNIGFDSMVFIDDNSFERNIVRENIQSITVPEMPEDPSLYLEYLYSLNLFETASYSSSDKDRTKQYQIQAQRAEFSKTFKNEDDFLSSLNMESTVEPFTKFNTPRVAQLSQRSNQFNLRTVRYTEADIKNMADDPNIVSLAFTLKDKFGDNGLIAVIILKKINEEELFIDTWFMSCRVLKRGMENFTLNKIVEIARKIGAKRIIGEYIPTLKNEMVKDHYKNLGFSSTHKKNLYSLDVYSYKERKCYIKSNENVC